MSKILNNPLGFGGAAVAGTRGGYSFGGLDDAESLELLQKAREHTMFFDTAPIYGFGESERRIGRAFKHCREKVFIASKSGITWQGRKVARTNDPRVTGEMLHQSLKNLATDYIDLYMVHWPDPEVDIRRPVEVLARAQKEQKIRHIGLCNTTLEDLDKALQVAPVAVVQSELNAFQSPPEELLSALKQKAVQFQSWGTLDKGILSGAVTASREKAKDYPPGDSRRKSPWWNQPKTLEKIERVEKLEPLLKDLGHSLLEWAIGHNLNHRQADQVLIGARTPAQFNQVAQALRNLPTRETLEHIQQEW